MFSYSAPIERSLPPRRWSPGVVSSDARHLVRFIFSKRRDELGLSTQEIYRDCLAFMPDRPMTEGKLERSRVLHPFRGIRYVAYPLQQRKTWPGHKRSRRCSSASRRGYRRRRYRTMRPEDLPNPPSRPAKPDLVELVASIKAGEEQKIKAVLPVRGQILDTFWVWRALPALFAPVRTGEFGLEATRVSREGDRQRSL